MLLQGSNIVFAYTGVPVLREVNVTLAPGEIVALIGPNGSGKSTLLKVIAGHLHASGSIAWDGKALNHWRPRELARRIAYLPQSPSADVDHRVVDVLRLGRSPYWSAFGLESSKDSQIVEQIARELALEPLLNRRIDELSGGQRQRVFIARCLVQEPAAMLLDEPNTFLDLRHQIELLQLLKLLAHGQEIGILIASHDLNLVSAFADRMILLDNGTIASSGTPQQVLSEDLLTRVYGLPMQRIELPDGRTLTFPRLQPKL